MMSSDTSTVGGIQGYLLQLHSFLGDTENRNTAVCRDIIGDLEQECKTTKNENELVLQTSLLFAKEEGLLSFLRKSLSNEKLQDTRVKILKFLAEFLQIMSVAVRGWEKNYAVDLKDICMVVYTRDKAAVCRNPALCLLIKILYLTKDSSITQDLKVGDMFNKFYRELCQKNKISDGVLGSIYELLGVLGEVHPSEMVNNSEKLYKAYLGELKGQMTSTTKEPKLHVVAGCLKGITALMENFTKSVEDDPVMSKEIFDYTLKAICLQTDKRYAVICAGLKLFAKHSSQFGNCLMDHYMSIFDVMFKLCGHIHKELKKSSYKALVSFLKQVATLVAENIELHKSKLKFFMQKFYDIMRNMKSTNKELSIAIRGYGLFAAPWKVVSPQDVDLMYTELVQQCKQMYLTKSVQDDDNVYQLPSFLDSIASVLIHLDQIPEMYTPVLERLLVVQMDSFPQYSQRMQSDTCRSIIKVFVAMAVRGPVLWSFTSSVVHQGLIRVCSMAVLQSEERIIPSGGSQADEDSTLVHLKSKVPSSKDYLDLFKGLLDCENFKDTGFTAGAPAAENYNLRDINRHLYDALVQSVMKIVEKLDLSVQKVTAADETQSVASAGFMPSSDPTANLMPNKHKDFIAFINLVDFCSDLLPSINPEYFAQWMHPLCHKLILQSIHFPLVSGFYKLLSLSMSIAKKIHYFQDPKQGPKSVGVGAGSTVENACFSLLAKFGKEVCVRLKQYKDELLAACLMFILSLHPDMVALDIKAYIPALQAALRLGLGHAPLATAALDALESWSSLIPAAVMQPHYTDILPQLDSYLKTTKKDDGNMEVTFVSTRSSKSYEKSMLRLLKKSKHSSVGDESPMAAVRRRVVHLLGHLGGQLNKSLVTAVSAEDMMKRFVAWDCEKRLGFAVPFKDSKPVIYLDSFLPRVTELALSSSDRQTKVAACELLHSLVIYMVGRGTQVTEDKSAPPMYNLHRKVFPVLLRLACDIDQVTKQLFEPLVMQLIHWFTNNRKFESQDTVAVLEAILDGIVDPLDSTLRDFSGTCIQEFVKWSIKQTTPEQQEKSPTNIKSLFKRISSLALHPNVFKRLGAALAFNSMYRQFREESSLVEQFVFEMLVVFVESLALAHFDEKSLGTVQQSCSSLDHLKRIIKHKADSLNKNSKRRIPRGFPPDQSVCLSDVVMWLLTQCGRPQTECRHKSMELFYEFAPLLPGNPSPAAWLDEQVKQRGPGFLISCLEGGGLLSQPTLRELEAPFSIRGTLHWMDLLLAALDCYSTFTKLHCVQPQRILGTGEKSSFLPAVRFFLTELSMQDVHAARACFRTGNAGQSHFSPRETEQYNYSKCSIIVRMLEFSTMVLKKCPQDLWKLMEEDVFNSSFFTLVVLTVCEPSSIGFNMADLEVITQLPEVCTPLLKVLSSTPYRTQLESSIRKRITVQSVEELCAIDLYEAGSRDSHASVRLLLSACKQLHQSGLLSSVLHGQDAGYGRSLGFKLLTSVYKSIAPGNDRKSLPSMDVGSRKLADRLVQLAFCLGNQSEQTVHLLLNTIPLSVPLSGSLNPHFLSFSHGEYFYSLFQTSLNTELLRSVECTVPLLLAAANQNPSMVSVLLNSMLDHSFRERSVRKSQGSRLAEQVLKDWDLLRPWWDGPAASPENKTSVLSLLAKVLQINSSVCFNADHPAFSAVFTTFTALLRDKSRPMPLNHKSQALIILPFFTALPSMQLEKLRSALETFMATHFPMQSNELPRGSLECNNYMDCIHKFLEALHLSQSPMLLKLMARVLCQDKKHIMEELFQTCFQNIAHQSQLERQVLLLSSIYQSFQAKDVPSNSMLEGLIDRVLLILASYCSPQALSQFFITNIADIMTTLQARFTKSVESVFESQIMMKIGCCKLLEVLYSRLPKEEVYSKNSAINQAFCGTGNAEGNELCKNLLKFCFEAFTENMAGETDQLQLRRRYHCAAYNCAIALISCSFNETKFYQGFLFTERPDKNQFIFDNLIDTQKVYNFPIEIDVPIEKKKKHVTIWKEVSGENGDAPVYLSSQSYMADSSLSEEISQFDFSTGVQSFSYNSQSPSDEGSSSRNREGKEVVSQDETVELEMDELNQHECMASMTALLRHMQRNNITPNAEEGVTPSDLPPWMKFLQGKLDNPSTSLNIRLFIAKLIINTEEIFRPYAKHWLGPLVQLVVSSSNGGEGIHFMVVDIVVTVLSWASVTTPKGSTRDEVLANRLLRFLVKNCFHTKRAVFRNNLEIIRTVMECWKDCLTIPYDLIYERFAGTDRKDNSVGIQLLGIVMANNLPPYDAECGIECDRYFQSLANNLLMRCKEVYAAAAEIIGLILKYMTEQENQNEGPLLNITFTKLLDLWKKAVYDKFIVCLSKVSKHFPPLVDRFRNHVFDLLPKLPDVLKTHCLECVLSRADVIPEIYRHLQTKGFSQIMSHKDDARQPVCLNIIHKILACLKPEELKEILGTVTTFVSHPSPVCRERMYDILMWIQDNYSDSESRQDSTSVEVLRAARESLLQGLTDENHGLQLYVRNFWSHESRLPADTLERMLVVLKSLYSSRIEEQFLSLATDLLLEMTSHSPDFTRNMFEFPLSECKFQDYTIDSNWRLRSTVLTPMFMETQATQGPEAAGSQAATVRGQIRATQTALEFSQTLAPGAGRRSAYNWLTGSSVDTLADYSLSSDSVSSILVFEKKKSVCPQAAWRAAGAGFGSKRLTAAGDETDRSAGQSPNVADILRLRRRFPKDKEKENIKFAKKEIQSQRTERERRADLKIRQDAQVTLYRSYRVGDLPDIQIQNSSLIAPLQALAQRDATLAKQLFSSLFAGVLVEMEKSKSSNESSSILKDLVQTLNTLLSMSTVYFPPFISCVQDLSYHHKALLGVEPALVSASCLASLQQPMGILLLEESLLHGTGMSEEPPSKRARGNRELPSDTERWIHLAKLYRSLGDYDVVRGIFSGKIGAKSITFTALQAEAKNDYAEAVKLYNEALIKEDWNDGEPTITEKDFWKTAALEAYNHLTDWKSLQNCATVSIDDNSPVKLEKMWTEPFYVETYLQYMMRSTLKQLQLGERTLDLLSFVNAAMKIEEHKIIMETHYSQELSLLYILQEDYDRAKYYANNCMQVFMQNYSSIDPLLNRSRLTVLQSVQALTEIQDFLNYITGEVSVNSLKFMIRRWTSCYPDDKLDPMNVWDDIITSRCFFLDKILKRLTSTPENSMEVDGAEQTSGEELGALVKSCKFNMKLQMADSAWKQNNFPVAMKLLKELHCDAKTEGARMLHWVHSFSRFTHKKSSGLGSAEKINALLKTVPHLTDAERQSEGSSARILRDQKILLGTTYDLMASAADRSPSALETLGEDKVWKIRQLSMASSITQVVEGLQMQALELFRSAARKAEEEEQSFSQQHVHTHGIVEAYMTLANFCDRRLRESEQKEEAISSKLQSLPEHVVKMMLKALKLNSDEARLKFPRLLQLVELYPAETLGLMVREVVSVPCWLLIGWINQMMALLDKPQATAVQHVIEKIAECYPQALIYPYMISSESYTFEESASGQRNREFVEKLKSLLDKGGVIQEFVDALQQLTNPDMLFKDWWDDVKNQLDKPNMDRKKMKQLYEDMTGWLGDSKSPGLGSFRRNFIQKYSKKVEELLGAGGSNLFERRKDKDFLQRVDSMVNNMKGFQKEPGNMKEYSPWLSSFKAEMLKNELEVPGQYDGKSKPLPECHAKITGFDERVKVMTSIRRPKRIIIRGDDERDHPFLVKGGEDLRQDQRIEQLFGVMNMILSQDTACSQRSLALHTYQVIPITSRIGLIEWMENTCTLNDFLSSIRTEQEQRNPKKSYNDWISKVAGKVVGNIRQYAELYKKAKRVDIVINFRRIEQMVPDDLLKRAFVRMSTTPEAFLSLRSHFSSSHAVLCISHWILGIGDRHLSNFMINTETGGMIGIDFGHAFGSATQFLPVPELMPFRLTRQFVNLMQPMAESGLIQSVMVHSLRAFRDGPDLLLNTMDVFVKEPSLDWKNFELKQLKKGGTWTESVNTKEINWFPLQKVDFARRKLEGANPSVITSEELCLGFEKTPAYNDMLAVARGEEQHNIRARHNEKDLSVEDQVDCLLDQATDPNILGRVWAGWEPWI
ncbi:LOW QUALITY PROTEIN: DNA-dependent protein kinase catalytic subunit-like [Megalobrama amblycephala]|uniref:LOW QUALITY PROTEIN: DNA-dependent protein kinase catalytic subunit-like n=1 Tax=Megalobrama amblycephala TaxID=75352 RepID=UPI002013E02F|nr:LOW QUALITY PROTEIN: DNA-dependent protein kinase catalytic subunit-like [Megalobrama amblycephala]